MLVVVDGGLEKTPFNYLTKVSKVHRSTIEVDRLIEDAIRGSMLRALSARTLDW
jgi:hypothetical protein